MTGHLGDCKRAFFFDCLHFSDFMIDEFKKIAGVTYGSQKQN